MLVTKNVVLRIREWLDRQRVEPDLVPRYRRVWSEAPARREGDEVAVPSSAVAVLHGPRPLHVRAGV